MAIDDCEEEAGRVGPVIDRERCEGKEDCVRACPYSVFEVRRLGREERSSLSLKGRLKALVHGGRQAFAVRADRCHACAICVAVCPEHAIRLSRVA